MEAVHVQEMSPKPLVSTRDSPAIMEEREVDGGGGALGSLEEPDGGGNPRGASGLIGSFLCLDFIPI